MKDFLKKFSTDWTPENIMTEPVSEFTVPSAGNEGDRNDIELAKRLASHLNAIMDYQDRIQALDYLADQAKANFDNISYTTAEESLINAIISIGGKDGTVDFLLAQTAISIIMEYMDKTALEAITGKM